MYVIEMPIKGFDQTGNTTTQVTYEPNAFTYNQVTVMADKTQF
jgi:hypothetical protein